MTTLLLSNAEDWLPVTRDLLQVVSSLLVCIVAIMGMLALRALFRAGNRVQIDIDMQVMDLGGEQIGELMVVLQNLGPRSQRVQNLFIEIRPSRHVSNGSVLVLVPVTNMLGAPEDALMLAPGVRQALSWTFEVPRESRLLRATALINTGKWQDSEVVPTLAQKHFGHFGPSVRYASRVFEAVPSAFRRF
jgi:hypothetical protein